MPLREAVNYKSETPFDNIESALEYVNHLFEATREAHDQIGKEIVRAANPQLARRKQALQLVNYKLDKLSSHIAASRRILNDLRTLRRLLLEERKTLHGTFKLHFHHPPRSSRSEITTGWSFAPWNFNSKLPLFSISWQNSPN